MCGFIAQLVEHRTSIAEDTGSNPVEALIFFRLLLSNCLNWRKFTAMIILHFHSLTQVNLSPGKGRAQKFYLMIMSPLFSLIFHFGDKIFDGFEPHR